MGGNQHSQPGGLQPTIPPSPEELPASVKQAYRTFAAVPGPPLPQDDPAQVQAGRAVPSNSLWTANPFLEPLPSLCPSPAAPYTRVHGLPGAVVLP